MSGFAFLRLFPAKVCATQRYKPQRRLPDPDLVTWCQFFCTEYWTVVPAHQIGLAAMPYVEGLLFRIISDCRMVIAGNTVITEIKPHSLIFAASNHCHTV